VLGRLGELLGVAGRDLAKVKADVDVAAGLMRGVTRQRPAVAIGEVADRQAMRVGKALAGLVDRVERVVDQVRGRVGPLDSAPVVVTAARQRGALVQPAVARGPAALAGQHSDRPRDLARGLQLLAVADQAAVDPYDAPLHVDVSVVTYGATRQPATPANLGDLTPYDLLAP